MKQFQKIRMPGHRENQNLFDGPVVVQEKIDGSNFGFGWSSSGKLCCMSRTQLLDTDNPSGMFAPAIKHLLLQKTNWDYTGAIFRCEYLSKPKHNVLAYGRMPRNNLVLFDIEQQGKPFDGNALLLKQWADNFEIEAVPQYWNDVLTPLTLRNFFATWEKRESLLGGPIEGVVLKNYSQTDPNGNVVMAKVVKAEFKEHHAHLKASATGCPLRDMGCAFGGPARWRKAVGALRDLGVDLDSMEAISALIGRVRKDVEEECKEELKEMLWKKYRKDVLAGTANGLPQWWAEELRKIEREN